MPMPLIAVGLKDGVIVYTNPACADLLGYVDSAALTAQSLPALMSEHAHVPPRECVTALIGSAAMNLNHADGYVISTVLSQPFLRRTDDPVLLVGLTDTTELSWTNDLSSTCPDETTPPALIV
jgi:PAS domain-containing protein